MVERVTDAVARSGSAVDQNRISLADDRVTAAAPLASAPACRPMDQGRRLLLRRCDACDRGSVSSRPCGRLRRGLRGPMHQRQQRRTVIPGEQVDLNDRRTGRNVYLGAFPPIREDDPSRGIELDEVARDGVAVGMGPSDSTPAWRRGSRPRPSRARTARDRQTSGTPIRRPRERPTAGWPASRRSPSASVCSVTRLGGGAQAFQRGGPEVVQHRGHFGNPSEVGAIEPAGAVDAQRRPVRRRAAV